MKPLIIYEIQSGLFKGNLAIIHPILDNGLTLEEIIEKDVPKGVDYKIIEADDLPADRTNRNDWKFSDF